MRAVRPELPVALDRVVLKGLERDRQRRFHDLQEFRESLVALLPRAMTGASLAVRLAAFVADIVLVVLVLELLKSLVRAGAALVGLQSPSEQALCDPRAELIAAIAWFLYLFDRRGSVGRGWATLAACCACAPGTV